MKNFSYAATFAAGFVLASSPLQAATRTEADLDIRIAHADETADIRARMGVNAVVIRCRDSEDKILVLLDTLTPERARKNYELFKDFKTDPDLKEAIGQMFSKDNDFFYVAADGSMTNPKNPDQMLKVFKTIANGKAFTKGIDVDDPKSLNIVTSRALQICP